MNKHIVEAILEQGRLEERAKVAAWFRYIAKSIREDADAGLWDPLQESDVEDAIDEYNGHANKIEAKIHLKELERAEARREVLKSFDYTLSQEELDMADVMGMTADEYIHCKKEVAAEEYYRQKTNSTSLNAEVDRLREVLIGIRAEIDDMENPFNGGGAPEMQHGFETAVEHAVNIITEALGDAA